MSYRGIAWRLSFFDRVNFDATTIMAVAAAASAAVSAVGAIQQGDASRKTASYQAALAENNAIAARQQAEIEERQLRDKSRQLMSAQRARAAKGGVLPEEGSPLLFSIGTGEDAEIDALNIRRHGEMQASQARSQAALTRYQGRLAQRQSYFQAGSTLLTGVSSVASAYRKPAAAAPQA